MTSPFIPNSFTYGDAPQGGQVMPMVIAGRNPSDSTDSNYAAGYLWLSSLDQGGSGNLYVQSGNTVGIPNWVAVTAGSAGGINTISDGSTQVSPVGGNIALEGTAQQILSTADVSAHSITFSIPAVFVAPGSIKSTSTIEVGTDLTVDGNASVTGNLAVTGNGTVSGDLTVTGNLVTGGITENGNVGINTSGSGTTTIGNAAAGAITFDVGTGNFALNGGGNTINLGTDAAANTIVLGNTIALTSVHIQSGTGDIKIDGSTTAKIILGTTTQTGTITIGQSTAGENIDIGSAINTVAQTITIGNGASGENSTVNILSGAGTAGAGVLALGNNARVTTIGIGNVAPAAARTITISGGNQAQNDTVSVLNGNPSANTQTFNLMSGTATGGTQVVNLANGIGGALTINMGNGVNSTAQTINIANGASAGNSTVNILSGNATSGTLALNLGNGNGPKTVAIATGISGNTVNIATGINTSAQSVNISSGASGANSTVSILSGNATAGTITLNLATGNRAKTINMGTGIDGNTVNIATGINTTAQSVNISSGAAGANSTVSILSGNATAGTQTLNLATGTGGKTVHIADGAGTNVVTIANGASVNTVTIGSINSTSTTTINAGSGNIVMVGNVTKTTNPSFLAYLAATVNDKTGNGTAYTLGTDALTEVFDRGSNFNVNGTFTAPVTGIYDLRSQVTVTGATIATTFVISIVTTARTYTHTFIKAAGAQNESVLITALCDMSATDTAHVTITVSGEAGDTDDILGAASAQTYFCGCLVA